MHERLLLYHAGIDHEATDRLALEMLNGIAVPFRTFWRACSALLDGNGTISAAALQQVCDAAIFDASTTCGADVEVNKMSTMSDMVPGLTVEQGAAAEAALIMVKDRPRWDGLREAIAAALGAGPTYSGSDESSS